MTLPSLLRAPVAVDTVVRRPLTLKTLVKIGVILMLLVLLIGPMLQIYDCFNDAPNLDHDALLHTVDALLSIALILGLSCILFWAVAICRWFEDRADPLRTSPFIPSLNRLSAFSPQPGSLRI